MGGGHAVGGATPCARAALAGALPAASGNRRAARPVTEGGDNGRGDDTGHLGGPGGAGGGGDGGSGEKSARRPTGRQGRWNTSRAAGAAARVGAAARAGVDFGTAGASRAAVVACGGAAAPTYRAARDQGSGRPECARDAAACGGCAAGAGRAASVRHARGHITSEAPGRPLGVGTRGEPAPRAGGGRARVRPLIGPSPGC